MSSSGLRRNIRLTVQYDGGRYLGWQRLGKEERTIQGKLEQVLCRVAEEPISVVGASRTDAGVHAEAQVANFLTSGRLAPVEVLDACHRYLPEDIVVTAADEADPRFHARYLARSKTYRYRLCNRPRHDVFLRRYALHVPEPLDLEAVREAAALLVGRKDFRSFAGPRSKAKSTVRTVSGVEVLDEDGIVDLLFRGDGFLTHMVRIMTGTLLEVGLGRRKPQEVAEILAAGQRPNAGPTAPPHGLCLVRVEY